MTLPEIFSEEVQNGNFEKNRFILFTMNIQDFGKITVVKDRKTKEFVFFDNNTPKNIFDIKNYKFSIDETSMKVLIDSLNSLLNEKTN